MGSVHSNLGSSDYKDNCIKVNAENLEFELCVDPAGIIIKHKGKERMIDYDDFRNPMALRVVLHETFGYHIDSEINHKLSFAIKNNKEIYEIINKLKNSGGYSYCIKKSDGFCQKELRSQNGSIYVVNYKLVEDKQRRELVIKEDEPQEIAKCSIDYIAKIKLIGINEKYIYKVVFNGDDVVVGDVETIQDHLKNFGTEYGYIPAIIRMIISNAVAEEQLYYSSGAWIVDNKVVIAKTSGYITSWKENTTFSVLENYDLKDVKRGIELIEKIVNAYGNPAKAVSVISYGVIAWAKHWFVEKAQYFPHLIIYGKENLGKSLLLDLLRIMYNVPQEQTPIREFQLRRISTLTTIPAILNEGNPFIEAMRKDEKLLQALTLISTTNVFTKAGSSEYGGLYLPIRAFIIPTNKPVDDLVPYVKDKIIIIKMNKDEGFKDDPSIITPRRMTEEDKKALRAVMAEVFKEFERRIPEIEKAIKNMSREKLYEYYIELGYDILYTISSRFLITLPKPFVQKYKGDTGDVEDTIKQAFYMFVEKEKNDKLRVITSDDENSPVIDPVNPGDALQKYGFFISTKYNTVVFNSAFLRKFAEYLVKELGMEKYSVDLLREMLNVKETMLTRYGEKLHHVYEIEYNKSKEEYCKSLDGKDVGKEDLEYCAEFGYYDDENHVFRLYK